MVIPPIADHNSPYASVPRLTGWLRTLGHEVTQIDLSLELFLRVFSRDGLTRVFDAIDAQTVPGDFEDVYLQRDRYIRIIDDVVRFAQGKDEGLAQRIARRRYLPEGPHFRRESAKRKRVAFGTWGDGDLARELVGHLLHDLTDLIQLTISKHYQLNRYAESLSASLSTFDEMHAELARPRNLIEDMMIEVADALIPADVDLVCMTCPFPGNLFGALLLGQWLARERPRAPRALGGGYPSTELRSLSDPRVFDFVDYVVLDDGELPLQQICARLSGDRDAPLVKTFVRREDKVVFEDSTACAAPRFGSLPPPDYAGLALERYLGVLYVRNRVSQLQTQSTWLKVTAAHGCYWKKCAFCDVTLPYIGDFEPMSATELADQLDAMYAQTGRSGFHFTDEAAPPSLLVALALELLKRGRAYRFWGNVRYDTYYTPDRCRLLAAAGMVAVTGGVEVASDALLPKIEKGITVTQVVKVLQAFAGAGILTHAYLIYGFPGETGQDTINSLEVLRQLMRARLLHSAFYHQFALTAHAPIAKRPALYGVRINAKDDTPRGFAHYVLPYDNVDVEPSSPAVFNAVQRAIVAFSLGEELDRDIASWFTGLDGIPVTTTSPTLVEDLLPSSHPVKTKDDPRLCWLGEKPSWKRGLLTVVCERGDVFATRTTRSVADDLSRCHPSAWAGKGPPHASELQDGALEMFRERGLVLL